MVVKNYTEIFGSQGRGHCSLVSGDGKVISRAETATKEEQFRLVRVEPEVMGRHQSRNVS